MSPEQEFLGKLGFAMGLTLLFIAAYGLGRSLGAMLPPRRRRREPTNAKPAAKVAGAAPPVVSRPVGPGPLWENSRMNGEAHSHGGTASRRKYRQNDPLPEVDVDPRGRGWGARFDDGEGE